MVRQDRHAVEEMSRSQGLPSSRDRCPYVLRRRRRTGGGDGMMLSESRPDLTRTAGDPFVGLVVTILGSLAGPDERMRWCRKWLPMSSRLLDLDRSWEHDTTTATVIARVVLPALARVPAPPRRNYQPQICRRCGQNFLPTTGRVVLCTICRVSLASASLSQRKRCVVCDESFMPKLARQRSCGRVECRNALHNQAARDHWERRGAGRQSQWYWTQGGKDQKREARLAKRAVAT